VTGAAEAAPAHSASVREARSGRSDMDFLWLINKMARVSGNYIVTKNKLM